MRHLRKENLVGKFVWSPSEDVKKLLVLFWIMRSSYDFLDLFLAIYLFRLLFVSDEI